MSDILAGSWGLFWALYSGIIPGRHGGPYEVQGIDPELVTWKSSTYLMDYHSRPHISNILVYLCHLDLEEKQGYQVEWTEMFIKTGIPFPYSTSILCLRELHVNSIWTLLPQILIVVYIYKYVVRLCLICTPNWRILGACITEINFRG